MTSKTAAPSDNSEHLTHPKYRADIDGLRAIAILSVVGFHAFPFWVKGGFIGVDIFFVISGYLISTIIISSLERNSFSFIEFYSRRIRRIFPALLLVLMACFTFGWFALLADEYKQLGKHITGSAAFVSNFLFWNENGYFDNAAETKPLLHIWSLGIEEQYYVVWPLLLWLAWKKRFNFLVTTLVIALISFVLNVVYVRSDTVAAFYSPQTRFWELLMGSVLAYVTLHKQSVLAKFQHRLDTRLARIFHEQVRETNGSILCNVQSVFGAVLIVIGIILITKERQFPGWWALLPTLGAVLVISAGSQAWLNRVILSSRVLVWFGLISYPLYLWHWPLLSFSRILASEMPSIGVRIGAVVVSITLAWLTYRFIENPVRFGLKKLRIVWILIFLAISVGAIGYYTYRQDGLGFRIGMLDGGVTNDLKYRHGGFYEGARDCSDIYTPLIANTWCAKKDGDPVVAVIGDSHAGQLFLGLKESSDTKFSQAIFMGAGSCYATLDWDSRDGCGKQLKLAFDIIEKTKSIQFVFVVGFYGWTDKGDEFAKFYIDGYKKTIDYFLSIGRKVVFVIDNPALGFDPEACLSQERPIEKVLSKLISKTPLCPSEFTTNLIDQSKYRAYVGELVASYPDVLFYDPQKKLCSNGVCKIIDNGKLLYSDWNHLSRYGSSFLANDIFMQLRNKW